MPYKETCVGKMDSLLSLGLVPYGHRTYHTLLHLLIHGLSGTLTTQVCLCGQADGWQLKWFSRWHEVSAHKNVHGCFLLTALFKLRIL